MNMKNLSKKIAAFVLTTILAGTLSAPLPVQAANQQDMRLFIMKEKSNRLHMTVLCLHMLSWIIAI